METSARLLIVDDDPSVRAMLREYLHSHGYAVGEAASGAQMRECIEADLPDVIESGRLDSIFGLASRDVRSLIAAIGTVAGQCYWTLIILAAVSALTIAWRLVYLRATVGGRRFPTGT